MKKLLFTHKASSSHWVGDGFPVQSVFTYDDLASSLSPFLLFDYAGPKEFPPTTKRLGVGDHPHRGFETVTIVYEGEVEHKDSAGGGGQISKGEVQWMTAASGVVHQEYHGRNFAKTGGRFEMIQLWVNLPARFKMSPPRYQSIRKDSIPELTLPNRQGLVRVIAGEFENVRGPTKTFTPINLWDVRLNKDSEVQWSLPQGHTCAVFVLQGKLSTTDGVQVSTAELAVFDPNGNTLNLKTIENTLLLFMGGEPIPEPIVGYGPFVMNTEEEIKQAYLDYRSGKMGKISISQG